MNAALRWITSGLGAATLAGVAIVAGRAAKHESPTAEATPRPAAAQPAVRSPEGSPPTVPSAEPPAEGVDMPLLKVGKTVREKTPAGTYAALGGKQCEQQLTARGIPFTPLTGKAAKPAPDVDRPVRITGPIHGVTFRGTESAKARKKSVFEIADCRLLLALDDMATALRARGIVEVIHFSMHRPGARRANGKPSQHELGLAIDVATFKKADGTELVVKTDWNGAIGDPPCDASRAKGAAAELRRIVCGLAEKRLFHIILTPNANADHADHVHFDLTRNSSWFEID